MNPLLPVTPAAFSKSSRSVVAPWSVTSYSSKLISVLILPDVPDVPLPAPRVPIIRVLTGSPPVVLVRNFLVYPAPGWLIVLLPNDAMIASIIPPTIIIHIPRLAKSLC
jgi:hypothetical protein